MEYAGRQARAARFNQKGFRNPPRPRVPLSAPPTYDPRVDVVLEQLAAFVEAFAEIDETINAIIEAHNVLVEDLFGEPEEQGELPDEDDIERDGVEAKIEEDGQTLDEQVQTVYDREAQRRALRDQAAAANESSPIEADTDPNAIDDVPEDGISLGRREEGDIA